MLRAILVDDEYWALKTLETACTATGNVSVLQTFQDSTDALEFVRENNVDLAFLDVEMPTLSGVELAARLREIHPRMLVVFVSAFGKYLADSCRLEADYYILKPYTQEQLAAVVDRMQLLAGRLKKRIHIRTFGRFDMFVDGAIVPFSSTKAKELLAIYVDARGSAITAEQAFNLLWEDKVYDNYSGAAYRKTFARLRAQLEAIDCGDLILDLGATGKAVDTSMFDCDYYQFLDGDPDAVRQFAGEYMVSYSWAEYTTGHLVALAQNTK